MKSKVFGCLLAGVLLAGMLLAVQGLEPVDIQVVGAVSPLRPVSGTVVQGRKVMILVPNDNFTWEQDEMPASGEHAVFTPAMIVGMDLVPFVVGGQPAHFTPPQLEVVDGNLYLSAVALLPGEGISFPVGVQSYSGRQTAVCSALFTIQTDSGGGNPGGGGENPGGGGENPGGGGENPGGGGENPGGGGENPGGGGENPGGGGENPGGGSEPNRLAGLRPGWDGAQLTAGSYEVRPGGHIWIPLPAEAFRWTDAAGAEVAPQAGDLPGLAQLQEAGIRVELAGEKPAVVTGVALSQQAGTAGVTLQMADSVISLQDVPFTAQMRLYDAQIQMETAVEGTVAVPVQPVDGGAGQYFSVENGSVLEPRADCPAAEVYLGGGVTAEADLQAGQRYTGIALREGSDQSGVESVCQVHLLGFGRQAAIRIDAGETLPIYDAAGNYLGMTGARLPVKDTYYIYRAYTAEPSGGTDSANSPGGTFVGTAVDKTPAPAAFFEEPEEIFQGQNKVETPLISGFTNVNDNPSTGN